MEEFVLFLRDRYSHLWQFISSSYSRRTITFQLPGYIFPFVLLDIKHCFFLPSLRLLEITLIPVLGVLGKYKVVYVF